MINKPNAFDVLIVGAGPSGLTLANILANLNISVGIFDKKASTVKEPRAVSIDDESLRIIQSFGLHNLLRKNIAENYGSHYFDGKGKLFLKVEPKSFENGFFKRNAFDQPFFENLLRENLKGNRFAKIKFNSELTNLKNLENSVEGHFKDSKGNLQIFKSKYIVGCDGAQSSVRRLLNLQMIGASFSERWLIVDLYKTKNYFRHTEVYCDVKRPSISLPGPKGIRRYEFMLKDHENEIDEKFVRSLLKRVGPDAAQPLRRHQVYHFHARMTSHWKIKSIFLAGDAAHLSPPFAGQGMNSGIRDVGNLGWKLAFAIKVNSQKNKILETYGLERRKHAWDLIKMAINMGKIMMPKNYFSSFFVKLFFRTLHLNKKALSYVSEMKYRPKPKIENGFIFLTGNESSREKKIIGTLFPQPLLEQNLDKKLFLDDIIGNNFSLIYFSEPKNFDLDKFRNNDRFIGPLKPILIVPQWCNVFPSSFRVFRDVNDVLGQAGTTSAINKIFLLRPDKYIAAIISPENIRDLIKFIEKNEIFKF